MFFFLHSKINLGVDNFSNQNMQNSVSQGAFPDNQTSSHTQIFLRFWLAG